nr:hypothetical protein [Tanacetum cinerariifolium]
MDASLSHPLPPTPVVGEMHTEAQQAAGGPTSLGDTSKDGAHSQLEDLADILKDTRSAFFTPDSPTNEPIIISDMSEEEKNVENDKDTKDTLVPLLEKLKTLDSLPGLLKMVINTLNRFTTLVANASEATTTGVPSADKATASPAEGEKNADTNLKNKLVDLFGIDIVTQYYNKKLLYER